MGRTAIILDPVHATSLRTQPISQAVLATVWAPFTTACIIVQQSSTIFNNLQHTNQNPIKHISSAVGREIQFADVRLRASVGHPKAPKASCLRLTSLTRRQQWMPYFGRLSHEAMNQFWHILANFLEQQKGFAKGRAIHPFYFGLLGFCYVLLSNGEFFFTHAKCHRWEKSSGKPQSTRPPETFSETLVAIKNHRTTVTGDGT